MDVEIISERENPLLGRKEVRFRVRYPGAGVPKRQEVRSKLVATLDSKKEFTVLDSLKPEYGSQSALGYIKVYDNPDAMNVEAEHKKKRNFGAKEEKPSEDKGDKPAEAKEKASEVKEKPAAKEEKPAAKEEKPAAKEEKPAAKDKKEA